MKPILTTLFLVCIHTIALSQEYKATFGKKPTCNKHGGICSIQSSNNQNKTTNPNNVSFMYTKEGATILRIYREKLTKDEQDRILGTPILSKSKEASEFIMEEALPLPEEISRVTATDKSKQLTTLEAKTYPTVITEEYKDITIIDPKKK